MNSAAAYRELTAETGRKRSGRITFPDAEELEQVAPEELTNPNIRGRFIVLGDNVTYILDKHSSAIIQVGRPDEVLDQAMDRLGSAAVVENFELEREMVRAMSAGPAIEVGGPTRYGFDLLQSFAAMPDAVYKSNIEAKPLSYEKTNELSYVADATQLPHPNESIGVVLCAGIGGGTEKKTAAETRAGVFAEFARVLKPGGLVVAQGFFAEDLRAAAEAGWEIKMARVLSAQKIGDREVVGVSAVLQKPEAV